MKQPYFYFSKFKIVYIVTFIIALAIGALAFLLWFFLKDRQLFDAINASTISMVILLGTGAILWLNTNGTFDGIIYGAKQVVAGIFFKKANKYNKFPDYVSTKNTTRRGSPKIFISFLAAGVFFGLALVVLEIIYHAR